MVAGELQQVGPSVPGAPRELVNAESGEVLATARETAKDSTGILDAVDRVSKQLRERIGESLRTIRADAPLADVTTGSLEALRNYLPGAAGSDRRATTRRAIALLEDAVAADSTFAMAWRKLGTMLINAGTRPARAEEALTRAFALRDRLTFREQKLTENSYYSDARGQPTAPSRRLQSILAEYPNDSWAHNNLGVMYETTGHAAGAEQSYSRAAALEPENILAWGNIYTLRIGGRPLRFGRGQPSGAGIAISPRAGHRLPKDAPSAGPPGLCRGRGQPSRHGGTVSGQSGLARPVPE